MQQNVIPDDEIEPRKRMIARTLLLVAAAGALVSWIGALTTAFDTDASQSVVAVHDMLGFPVYAGLFAILARFPRCVPGIWELLIAQKVVMAILAFTVIRGDTDAALTGSVDGVLAAILIVAYVLVRGWEAWRVTDR